MLLFIIYIDMSNRIPVKGKFKPRFPQKYKGDPTNIIFRSSWELTVFKYLDNNKNVLRWSSEEFFVPYKNPLDGKFHRYYPDVYIEYINNQGVRTQTVWEIKPKKQTIAPKIPKRKTKSWKYNAEQYVINQAKWKSCKAYCDKRGYKFQVITEDVLKHWSTIPPMI
tara:strand:- start:2965 stop:3462 length:498 start_codon:yes stop_codon:yes gene_type:complete